MEPRKEGASEAGVAGSPAGRPAAGGGFAGSGRIPSLDGLRALSILLVLFGHTNGTRGFGTLDLPTGVYSNLGVRVFFVISGFLITSLLFSELRKTERIDLKGFYVRRMFRIFPAFYAYLGVVALASVAGLVAVSWGDLFYASTYTVNFVPEKAWVVGHIWSLSVEEQFYLLWPATLFFVGKRTGLWVAAAVVLLTPLVRVGWYFVFPQYEGLIGEAFPTVSDSIAAGCLFAGIRPWLHRQPLYQRVVGTPLFWLVPVTLFVVNGLPWAMPRWLLGETILNLSIVVIIDRAISRPDDRFGRLLNTRFLSTIGVLSYSLYLWQQPFLNRTSDAAWAAFPQNIVCVVVFAVASYYLVEKPMMNLRHRFSKPSAKSGR